MSYAITETTTGRWAKILYGLADCYILPTDKITS